jgi:DNA-directed RNA polymerase omega subunit
VEQPCLDEMMAGLDSKYALVAATAKRARKLTDGDIPCVEGLSREKVKSVSIAMQEIASGKVKVKLSKGGIK